MREILFRGKRLNTGEWIYGNVCIIYERYYSIIDKKDGRYWVDPATVGQYTGLTNKNGAKIFEGDIVSTKEYGKDAHGLNHVGFDTFQIRHYGYAVYLENSKRKFMLTPSTAQTCEIIGNVHDNPELLEVRE